MKNIMQIIFVTGCFLFSLDAMAEKMKSVGRSLAETIRNCDSNFKFDDDEFVSEINKFNVLTKYCSEKNSSQLSKILCSNSFFKDPPIKISDINIDLKYKLFVDTTIDLSYLTIDQAKGLDFSGSIFHGVSIKPPKDYTGFGYQGIKTKSINTCSCQVSIEPKTGSDPNNRHEFVISDKDKKCDSDDKTNLAKSLKDLLRSFKPSSPDKSGSTNPAPAAQ